MKMDGRHDMSFYGLRFFWCCLIPALLLFACGEKIDPGTTPSSDAPAVQTRVDTARPTDADRTVEAVGTVQAQTASVLSGKLMGTVKSVLVEEGVRVDRDDPLALIDERQVAAHLRQAEAALGEARRAEAAALSAREAATAGAELARATYERYRQLMREESASRQEFDEVEARHRQARAAEEQAEQMVAVARQRVRQAEAAVSAAEVADNDAVIRAPYDGVVTSKLVDPGDLLPPGIPVIGLESAGGPRVDIMLTEVYFGAVQLGQPLEVRVPAAGETALVGIVDTIVPSADPASRSFQIKIRLMGAPSVRSGMFARVRVPIGSESLLAVPETALVYQGQLSGLFVVDERQTARFRLVRTGRDLGGGQVEVLSGLDSGMRFVVDPPLSLRDGLRVEALP